MYSGGLDGLFIPDTINGRQGKSIGFTQGFCGSPQLCGPSELSLYDGDPGQALQVERGEKGIIQGLRERQALLK